MMSKVPEIKLVKSYRLNRKKLTDEAALCFVNFYCLFLKATLLQQNLPLHLDYLVLPKRSRNKLMNFSCLINFIFSSTCNYVQLNYNNLNIICPAISISLPTSKTVAPCVSSRTPLKNGANVGKSHV